jgi:hypothetical protein
MPEIKATESAGERHGTWLRIQNLRSVPYLIQVEPWGDEIPVGEGHSLEVWVTDVGKFNLEFWLQDDRFVICTNEIIVRRNGETLVDWRREDTDAP